MSSHPQTSSIVSLESIKNRLLSFPQRGDIAFTKDEDGNVKIGYILAVRVEPTYVIRNDISQGKAGWTYASMVEEILNTPGEFSPAALLHLFEFVNKVLYLHDKLSVYFTIWSEKSYKELWFQGNCHQIWDFHMPILNQAYGPRQYLGIKENRELAESLGARYMFDECLWR